MYCENCGNEIIGGKFCTQCGTKCEIEVKEENFSAKCEPKNVCKKSSGKKALLVIIVLLLLLCISFIIGIILLVYSNNNSNNNSNNGKYTMESAAESYAEALLRQSASEFLELIPEDYIDYLKDEYDLSDSELEEDVGVKIGTASAFISYLISYDDSPKSYFDDIYIENSIKLGESSGYNDNSDCYRVSLTATLYDISGSLDFKVVQIDGKWYSLSAIEYLTDIVASNIMEDFFDFIY